MPGQTVLLVALLLLAGCERNTLVVIAPTLPPAPSPCRLSPGAPPAFPPGPQDVAARLHPSAQAMQARMAGCAGLRFRIAPDGTPRDVRVAVESPSGYGYGAAAVRALTASRYPPRPAETGPYYTIYAATFEGAAPSGPGLQPSAQPHPIPAPHPPTFTGLRT